MAIMKTLTVGGQTYTVQDPAAVSFEQPQQLTPQQQTQAQSNLGVWSNKDIADRLCPAFAESGGVVTCAPVEGYPLGVVSGIAPVQSGSGEPSPDNIRPITGHAAVKLKRCGKNLIGTENAKAINGNDSQVSFDNDTYTITFTSGAQYAAYKSDGNNEDVFPAGTYTVSLVKVTESVNMSVLINSLSNERIAIAFLGDHDDRYAYTFTSTEPFVVRVCGRYVSDLSTYGTYAFKLQLEAGSAATDYEPYRGDTFTLDLGQEVYGGCLDWVTGVLTVDRVFETLVGDGTDHIDVEFVDGFARITMNGCTANGEIQGSTCNHISSHFKTYHGYHNSNVPMWSVGGNPSVNRCWLYCDPAVVGTTADRVLTWLKEQYDAGTPVQASYKLATPITVQLTPQEITALSGVNTLYSDTGDTCVTGRADPAAVIEKLTTAILSLGGNV